MKFLLLAFCVSISAFAESVHEVQSSLERARRPLQPHVVDEAPPTLRAMYRGDRCTYHAADQKPDERVGFAIRDMHEDVLPYLYPIIRRVIAGQDGDKPLPTATLQRLLASPDLLRDDQIRHEARLTEQLKAAKANDVEMVRLRRQLGERDRFYKTLARSMFPDMKVPKITTDDQHTFERLGAGALAEGLIKRFAEVPSVKDAIREIKDPEEKDEFVERILTHTGRRSIARDGIPQADIDAFMNDRRWKPIFEHLDREHAQRDRFAEVFGGGAQPFCYELFSSRRAQRYQAMRELTERFNAGRMDSAGRHLRLVVELNERTHAFTLSVQALKPTDQPTPKGILVVRTRRGLPEDSETVRYLQCRGDVVEGKESLLVPDAAPVGVTAECRRIIEPAKP